MVQGYAHLVSEEGSSQKLPKAGTALIPIQIYADVIGLMNLLLHGITHPHIRYADTLSKKFDEHDQYDVVLANPPFKGSIDKSGINEDLALNTTKTELLFVNRIINLLRAEQSKAPLKRVSLTTIIHFYSHCFSGV
jgi:N-6 DNA Methylase